MATVKLWTNLLPEHIQREDLGIFRARLYRIRHTVGNRQTSLRIARKLCIPDSSMAPTWKGRSLEGHNS